MTIKQIYLTNDAGFANSDSRKKRLLDSQCDRDFKLAREIWRQIGIDIQRVGKPATEGFSGEITLLAAHQWTVRTEFGTVIPVVYIDDLGDRDRFGKAYPEFENGGRASIVMRLRYSVQSFDVVQNYAPLYNAETNLSYSKDSFAHEIGHVLLNNAAFPTGLRAPSSPTHIMGSSYSDHLMFAGLDNRAKSRDVIDFLPMTRNGKYVNQVEAMYTASSYVTAKTLGGGAPMSMTLDFEHPGDPQNSSDDLQFSGTFGNAAAPPAPPVPGRFGSRATGPPAVGRTRIYRDGVEIENNPSVPFAISTYERIVDGGISRESLFEFIITPDAFPPASKLTIPAGFVDTRADDTSGWQIIVAGGTIPIQSVGVEVISAAGVEDKYRLIAGRDYDLLMPGGFYVRLNHVNASVLQDGSAVVRIRVKSAAAPSGGTRGDFNADGIVNNTDVTLLYARMGEASTTYDLNGDGYVSLGDALELVDLIPGAFLGDLNFDGQVDGADLAALNSGWQTAPGRAGGDIDGDGLVTEVDLTLLANDWQAPPAAAHGVLPRTLTGSHCDAVLSPECGGVGGPLDHGCGCQLSDGNLGQSRELEPLWSVSGRGRKHRERIARDAGEQHPGLHPLER